MRFRLAALAAAWMIATSAGAQENTGYDVLFIAVDDLNDWVGYLGGHPQTRTPNIDRLAARGMAFLNAQTAAPLCNPTRTALLTGIRPSTSGIYGNRPDWRTAAVFEGKATLPRHFRDNGYLTVGAGKIFHAHTFYESGFTGFNDTTAWDDFYPSLDRQLPDEIGPPARPMNGNPLVAGFDWDPLVAEDYAMGDGQVVGWIQQQMAGQTTQSRFTAVGIFRPHLPWYVPERYFDLHPLEEVELPPTRADDLDDVSAYAARSDTYSVELHDWVLATGTWEEGVQGYLASVSYADAMVGRLMDTLDASGRADRTIIVLWGDHGFHLGEKGRWRKMTLWSESLHVPFIIVAPGVTTPGSTTRAPVSLMDIYPTLVDLAGIERPAHLEGRSLVPLLEDPALEWNYPVLSTYGYGNHAVVSERYRYISHSDGSQELYDMVADPNEWTNLAPQADYADVVDELRGHLPATNAPDLALAAETD
ncbi:MAG: sulfatase [Gammaproteobacteria bacterium]|jgi:arylsulfatase A-like enzyme